MSSAVGEKARKITSFLLIFNALSKPQKSKVYYFT